MSTDQTSPLARLWRTQADKSRTSEAIYRTLREAVLDGVLSPGERLSENDLASELGVSRTPIREALLRLESERLIWRPSGRSAVVSRLTEEEILDVYSVRGTLDGLAAELAAMNANPPQISKLAWVNSQMKDAADAGEFDTMARLNLEYHEALAEASGNGLLVYLMTQVHSRVRRFPSTTFAHPGRALEAIDEHVAIIEALEAGRADEARSLAKDHMDRAREIRLKMMERG